MGSSEGSSSNKNVNENMKVVEVECVKCDSCGFTEECTPAYISRLRQRYQGRWLCGLCVEAVKDELLRSDTLISTEEALNRHISFCRDFRAPTSTKAEHPLFAIGRILRRTLDSPRPLRTNSSGALPQVHRVQTAATPTLLRSESCFSSISSG
ncbi:hypothetical protein PIB30_036770 [Stylosanthes scabra]|uniref:DUF1677 family protein n=1 Tax=Stylosanthes scabra TaxID=79078 RepID=A0ABU6VE77_9FABA|nr:hypothetical protein [Stylosanthes scabra]